ncbi:MAG: glycosyltransferase family 9 protein [Maribacter sp.]|nr:glycosyltransferase family 9 protein [Maribacter sp.]
MGNTKHLLVIRLSAMGDVAMMVPVIKSLLDSYPNLKITVLTKGAFRPIFKGLDNITVHVADVTGTHKGIGGLWKLYKELQALQLDAVADLHNVLRSNALKLLFRLNRTPFVQIEKGRKEKKALTTVKNKVFAPLKSTHQRYVDAFNELGFSFSLPDANFLNRNVLSEKALKIVGSDNRKWLGIAPFAAFSGKMYPQHLMREVVQELNNTNKYKIFLLGGGAKEKGLLDKWEIESQSCINLIGKLSFDEELALISNLDLMLSMDSSNAHLAAMYGVPIVSLWGVTHPFAGFYPYGQDPGNALLADRNSYPLIPTSIYGNKLPKGYESVMETIQPNDVVSKINRLLNKK